MSKAPAIHHADGTHDQALDTRLLCASHLRSSYDMQTSSLTSLELHAAVACYALAIAVLVHVDPAVAARFAGTIISLNVALAFAASTFVVMVNRFSPYRDLLHHLPKRVVASMAAGLCLALGVPFMAVAALNEMIGVLPLAALPFIMWTGSTSIVCIHRCTSPRWRLSTDRWEHRVTPYLKELERHARSVDAQWEPYAKPLRVHLPMEMARPRFTVSTEVDDLWEELFSTASVAAAQGNIAVFRLAFRRMLDLHSRSQGQEHAENTSTTWLCSVFAYRMKTSAGSPFLAEAMFGEMRQYQAAGGLDLAEITCARLDHWFADVDSTLIVELLSLLAFEAIGIIHQAVEDRLQRGAAQRFNGRFYGHRARRRIWQIGRIGVLSAKFGNAVIAYRAMDAARWVGCRAGSEEEDEPAVAALDALVRIGRQSRAANLICFWDKCIVPIHDHALAWLGEVGGNLSIVGNDGQVRLRCQGAVATAYSRLTGFRHEVTTQPNGKSYGYKQILKDGEPVEHVETMVDKDGLKGSINYSDSGMLVEYELSKAGRMYETFWA